MTAIAIPARQRHVLAFGKPLGLTDEQIDATVVGDSGDPAWSDRDARPGAHETNEHVAMHEHATRTNPALVSGVRGEGAPPLLIQLCDELDETDSVSDKLWARLAGKWPPGPATGADRHGRLVPADLVRDQHVRRPTRILGGTLSGLGVPPNERESGTRPAERRISNP
jgi:hypothetical protein